MATARPAPEFLHDEFVLRGEFWVPGRKRRRLSGQLSYADGSIELGLQGGFDALDGSVLDSAEVIVGETDGGGCTLVHAERLERREHSSLSGSITYSRWIAPRLYVGRVLPRPNATFDRATFQLDELDDWLCEFDLDQSLEVSADGREVHVARHTMPPEITIELPSHSCTMTIGFGLSTSASLFRSLTWAQNSAITITTRSPRTFEWFMERLTDVRAFIGLLVGEPVMPASLTLSRPPRRGSENPELDRHLLRVRAFYSPTGTRRKRRLHNAFMLFTYDQVEDRFPAIVKLWFEKRDNLAAAVALFFGTLYAQALPGEFRFLALTQALETLHRRTRSGMYLTADAFEDVRKEIVAAIPPSAPGDLKDALKRRLEYGNEYSLRRRLKELYESLDPETRATVLPDKAFLLRVIAERNYLTHYPAQASASMSPVELFYTSMRLRALVSVLLLREVELSGSEVAGGLRRNQWFRGYVLDQ